TRPRDRSASPERRPPHDLEQAGYARGVATVFVTGGTGFIGARVVTTLLECGDVPVVLARSPAGARAMEALGARVVVGDLLAPGPWQTEARAADAIVHVAQPATFGGRVTEDRARAWRDQRLVMDANLFDALDAARAQRVVYVAGTSYY